MTYSFNLIDNPWIPCAHPDGRMEELSLRETLARAHELRGIQGDSPLETASLYRLLLAVLHSALRGPADEIEWENLWKAKRFVSETFSVYFEKWHSRFDLFDEKRPFYQIREEQMVEKSALLLTHGMSTANELFEHSMVVETTLIRCAQATRMLLVGQYFGLGGLVYPGMPNLTGAPLLRGVTFLIEGNNLFETLLLNCLQYSKHKPLPTLGKDEPVWEMEVPFQSRDKPNGYLDYLTWQNRKVLLIPDEENGNIVIRNMRISKGLSLDKELEDPFKQYSKKDKGWKYLSFTREKSLWRDSHTLFVRNNLNEVHSPKTFDWLALLLDETDCLESKQKYRIMALGAGVHFKDAKIFFYRHENMPLPLAYIADESLVSKLSDASANAEQVKSLLWRATNTLARNLISPSVDEKGGRQPDSNDVAKLMKHWGAESNYWSALEIWFSLLVEELPLEPDAAMTRWNETLQQTAWDALRSAERMAGGSTAALKAAVKAEGVLYGELKKIFEVIQPQQEVTA